MPIDGPRIEAAVTELLSAIGEDPARPGLAGTPRHVADAFAEFFSGVGGDPAAPLGDTVALDAQQTGELVMLRDIAFRSICEHHLLPFSGLAHLAYLPVDRAVGLGRLVQSLEVLAARPQLQERLGDELAELGRLRDELKARLSKLEQRPWPSARWHAVDPSHDPRLAMLLARVERRDGLR